MKRPRPARHHKQKPPGHRMTNPLTPGGVVKRAPQHGGKKPPPPHHHQPPGRGKRMTNPLAPGGTVKRAGHHKRRGLALDGVACCSAEALAASLRLLGVPVGDEDVLALYWRTAADADAGATILETLEAASRFGLAGMRPAIRECGISAYVISGFRTPLILGVTLPGGPHALTLDPSGCVWSWGELYDLGPDVVIEEAWLVDWEG